MLRQALCEVIVFGIAHHDLQLAVQTVQDQAVFHGSIPVKTVPFALRIIVEGLKSGVCRLHETGTAHVVHEARKAQIELYKTIAVDAIRQRWANARIVIFRTLRTVIIVAGRRREILVRPFGTGLGRAFVKSIGRLYLPGELLPFSVNQKGRTCFHLFVDPRIQRDRSAEPFRNASLTHNVDDRAAGSCIVRRTRIADQHNFLHRCCRHALEQVVQILSAQIARYSFKINTRLLSAHGKSAARKRQNSRNLQDRIVHGSYFQNGITLHGDSRFFGIYHNELLRHTRDGHLFDGGGIRLQ